ncbi:hypothetical protein DPMN_068285 [Dreissena polymorpha]|uniref:Uncharacterized protein n=1 Tax=Dreissena polymorpha TaxID=45954 RepID=A0A9D4BM28_DREPO|nr:hypothetical protein DPMN_068285 [Dreissena polymorpha]
MGHRRSSCGVADRISCEASQERQPMRLQQKARYTTVNHVSKVLSRIIVEKMKAEVNNLCTE